MLRRKDLRKRIDRVIKVQTESEFKVMIDYTRNTFYSRQLKLMADERKGKEVTKLYGVRNKLSSDMFISFVHGIKRLMAYQQF